VQIEEAVQHLLCSGDTVALCLKNAERYRTDGVRFRTPALSGIF